MLLVTVRFSTASIIATVITPGPTTVAEFCQHVVEQLLPGDLVAMLYTGQSMVCIDYGMADSNNNKNNNNNNNNNTILHHGPSEEASAVADLTPVVSYSMRMSMVFDESVAIFPAVCAPQQSMYALVLAARACYPYGTNVVVSIRPILVPTQPRRGSTINFGHRYMNALDYGFRPASTTKKVLPRKRALSKITTTQTRPAKDRSKSPIMDNVDQLRTRQRPRTIAPTEEPTKANSKARLPNHQPVVDVVVKKTGKAAASTRAPPSSHSPVVAHQGTKKSGSTASLGSVLEPLPLETTTTTSSSMPSSTRFTKDELSILARVFLEEEPADVEEDHQRRLTDDELVILRRAFLMKDDGMETTTQTTTKKKVLLGGPTIPLRNWGRRKPDHRAANASRKKSE
jgi:hypothetical protein